MRGNSVSSIAIKRIAYMKKTIIRYLVVGAAWLLCVNNAWAIYTCTGPVSGVMIAPNGNVSAEHFSGFSWVYICSVSTPTNGVSIDACKSIYSMMLVAQTTGKSVSTDFNDEPNTCASHTPWNFLSGWYFGPILND